MNNNKKASVQQNKNQQQRISHRHLIGIPQTRTDAPVRNSNEIKVRTRVERQDPREECGSERSENWGNWADVIGNRHRFVCRGESVQCSFVRWNRTSLVEDYFKVYLWPSERLKIIGIAICQKLVTQMNRFSRMGRLVHWSSPCVCSSVQTFAFNHQSFRLTRSVWEVLIVWSIFGSSILWGQTVES